MYFQDNSQFDNDEFHEALRHYERMVATGARDYMEAADLTDVAYYYAKEGRGEEATQAIDYCLKLHPDDIEPLTYLATQAMGEDRLEDAEAILGRIKEEDDEEVAFIRAEIALKREQPKEASDTLEACYHRASSLETDRERADYAFDAADLFMAYHCQGETEHWFKLLKSLEPESERTRQAWCEYLLDTQRDKEAFKEINRLIADNPFNTRFWNLLAIAHYNAGRYEKALDAIDNALAIADEEADIHIDRADCLLQLRRYEEAHQEFPLYERLRQEPTLARALYIDGIALCALGNYEEGLEELEIAKITCDAHSAVYAWTCLHLAYMQAKAHLEDEALANLEEAITHPDLRLDIEPEALRGFVYVLLGEWSRADTFFESAIEKAWDKPLIVYQIIAWLAETGHYAQALERLLPEYQNRRDLWYPLSSYITLCLRHYVPEQLPFTPEEIERRARADLEDNIVEELLEADKNATDPLAGCFMRYVKS